MYSTLVRLYSTATLNPGIDLPGGTRYMAPGYQIRIYWYWYWYQSHTFIRSIIPSNRVFGWIMAKSGGKPYSIRAGIRPIRSFVPLFL